MMQRTDLLGECELWTGPMASHGYGVMPGENYAGYAHRHAYEQANGPIPEGLVIDHLCRNPACVNPDHLEAIPQCENVRRGAKAKLTWDDVDRIRAMKGTMSYTAIGKRFGIHNSQISRVINGQAWTDPRRALAVRKRKKAA